MFSRRAKVFPLLIRITYKFDIYSFSLLLTAPGLDRVDRYGSFPPVKVFSPPFSSYFLFYSFLLFSLTGGSPKYKRACFTARPFFFILLIMTCRGDSRIARRREAAEKSIPPVGSV